MIKSTYQVKDGANTIYFRKSAIDVVYEIDTFTVVCIGPDEYRVKESAESIIKQILED